MFESSLQKKSKTFCVLPWIHLSNYTSGVFRLCCIANGNVVKEVELGTYTYSFEKNSLSEVWNSQYYKNIRMKMLNSEKINECQRCYKEESLGCESKRIRENKKWLEKYKEGSELEVSIYRSFQNNGELDIAPRYFDIRLGNLCNLACVICHPSSSRKVGKTWLELAAISPKLRAKLKSQLNVKDRNWFTSERVWSELKEIGPSIREICFAGGEPTLVREHFSLLTYLVENGLAKGIRLRYHTNGTNFSDQFLELMNEFKHVNLACSVDAIGEKNEFIRFYSDWRKFEENLEKPFQKMSHASITFNPTISMYNVFNFDELLAWFFSFRLKHRDQPHIHVNLGVSLLHSPTFLAVNLPENDKVKVVEKIQSVARIHDSAEFSDVINTITNYISGREFDWNLYVEFKEYLDRMDQIRGTDYKLTFPELSVFIANSNKQFSSLDIQQH